MKHQPTPGSNHLSQLMLHSQKKKADSPSAREKRIQLYVSRAGTCDLFTGQALSGEELAGYYTSNDKE